MDSKELTQRQAESVRASLDDIWGMIDHQNHTHSGEYDDECEWCTDFLGDYGSEDPREHLDEMPLEIVWEKGEPFAVVLGTGGPHVEITGGGREGGYALHVYWAGDHVTLRGESINRTGEYFRELVEEQES